MEYHPCSSFRKGSAEGVRIGREWEKAESWRWEGMRGVCAETYASLHMLYGTKSNKGRFSSYIDQLQSGVNQLKSVSVASK